jgi:hypothetical protein
LADRRPPFLGDATTSEIARFRLKRLYLALFGHFHLRVTIEGTWLEDCIGALYEELEERGIRLRPLTWISSEWFSPADVRGIAMPFYLAHPRLMKLEKK